MYYGVKMINNEVANIFPASNETKASATRWANAYGLKLVTYFELLELCPEMAQYL
jgi:hypothetical protein